MIWLLQNLLHYTGDYISRKDSILSSDFYPEQNLNFLNKVMFVPYRDENIVALFYRLYIPRRLYPDFDGVSGLPDNFCKVLRYDNAEPYKAILLTEDNYIIVGDTRELNKYLVYPGYIYDSYLGYPEAKMNMANSWEEFNEEYNSERFMIIHVQNQSYIGQPVYVEYFKDLLDKTPSTESLIQPDKIHGHDDARYKQDRLNYPSIATEKGYIIRADENGPEGEIVVLVEKSEVVGSEEIITRKYILGTEANLYINTEEPRKSIEEIDLWQPV